MNGDAPAPTEPEAKASVWTRAQQATELLAVDPLGLGGALVKASPGPVRDRWLALLRGALPAETLWRRLPAGISDDRLMGGLDLTASLRLRQPAVQRGLLAESDGGVVILPMAERLTQNALGPLLAALDRGEIALERDGLSARHACRIALVALDESAAGEAGPAEALADRLAFHLDLDGIALGESAEAEADPAALSAARARLPQVVLGDEALSVVCETAVALGVASLRAPLLALKAARADAALRGEAAVDEPALVTAIQLVLAPRARQLPQSEPDAPPPEEPDPPPDEEQPDAEPGDELTMDQLKDLLVEAAAAVLPPDLLAKLQLAQQRARQTAGGGRSGVMQRARNRGRPIGVRRGKPEGGARLHLLETLRAAAPLQRMRKGLTETEQDRIAVRPEDFRIRRFKQRSETATIFVVDASGSSALNRLAEAKGAVELLLADAYARRDQVALIVFGGETAELLLPPTRALARAKRALATLPGGGGTPLALGLDCAAELAEGLARRGVTPILVVMTDGQANIARDGSPGRTLAGEDALAAARRIAAAGRTALLIDTAPRPKATGKQLAEAMMARYLPLPRADAARLSQAVKAERGA